MDQSVRVDATGEEILGKAAWETSEPFVGEWRGLISTTNWEKGRIICRWRTALQQAGAPAAEFSDDAWSRLAGGVSAQHVGRLRRVFERFADVYQQYQGLYWSHFFAALDWEDAEMWLEGALQSSWSVSQLRRQRWQTLGAVENDRPEDADIVASEPDEDIEPEALGDAQPGDGTAPRVTADKVDRVKAHDGVGVEASHSGDADEDTDDEQTVRDVSSGASESSGASIYAEDDAEASINFVQPFAKLAELPDDVTEAFEAFKLAILRHKLDGWSEVSRDDLLASLDALKELALAPSPEQNKTAPF